MSWRKTSFKLGRFKAPVGLELLQSDYWTFFNERSIVTNLVPVRDLGISAGGELLDPVAASGAATAIGWRYEAQRRALAIRFPQKERRTAIRVDW